MSSEEEPAPPPGSPTPPDAVHVALDAKGLRALAHPVRVQLLGALRRYGASTATALGQRLGVSSGTASYHLRQLGAAGFVVEDSERGNNRERWWRAAHTRTFFDSNTYVEREPEATFLYHQAVAATHVRRLQDAVNEYATLPPRVARGLGHERLRAAALARGGTAARRGGARGRRPLPAGDDRGGGPRGHRACLDDRARHPGTRRAGPAGPAGRGV
ncbi:LOW QUALITY PROTEIN: ArsR family transcriptional regulator, partial [Streptomyces sp. SPB074]